jgi:hypothetical protein
LERYVIVKIKRVSDAEDIAFDKAMGTEKFSDARSHGVRATGPEFVGDLTVAALANAYGLELVCRVLRAARVPYSLHTGKPVRKRGKACTTSTQFTLTMVEITAEVQPTSTED